MLVMVLNYSSEFLDFILTSIITCIYTDQGLCGFSSQIKDRIFGSKLIGIQNEHDLTTFTIFSDIFYNASPNNCKSFTRDPHPNELTI